MKSTSRIRIILYIFSIAILLALVGAYAYIYRETNDHVNRAIAAKGDLSSEERSQADRKDLIGISDATAAARAKLSEYFISADSAVDFIQEVESIGPASGTKIVISSIVADAADKANPGKIGRVAARVAVTGSWSAVMKALELFETLPYLSTVNQVSLSTSVITGEKVSSARVWQLSLEVSASTLNKPQ